VISAVQKVQCNFLSPISNTFGLSIVDYSVASIRAAEAKDYLPAHKFTQPAITGIALGSEDTCWLSSGVAGEAETAVEQRAAKIIFENI